MHILEFPVMRQTYNYDCGAKALQCVLEYYGIDAREDHIMHYAHTNSKDGTSINNLVKTAKHYGLRAEARSLNILDIKKFIDKEIPVIVDIQAYPEKKLLHWDRDWKDGHYVVAIGYNSHYLFFADPSSVFITYLSYSEFLERWHDKDNHKKYFDYGIIVYGKKPKFKTHKRVHLD
jgi:ABC-type bacteriocin/lantibiotic exporter with double-glycine peptidase domain